MALTQIISKVDLGTWLSTNTSNQNYTFLTAKKDTAAAGDVVDSKDVKNITIALGLDSGIQNHPIIIQKVTLRYDDAKYGDEEVDGKVIFTKLVNIPSTFYIKVVSVETEQGQFSEGNVAISISLDNVKLL